ncbi:MAG: hypothetical protein RI933_970, partial [Actinomycetota bacterium]
MTTPLTPPVFKKPSPASIAISIVVAVGAALLGASGLYTDLLWFSQLGYNEVFTTEIAARVGLFASAAILMAAMVWGSFFIAFKTRPIYLKFPDERDPFGVYRQALDQLRKVIMWALPAVLGVMGGLAASREWATALAWLNRTETGQTDPQFGLDISFYLFDLPFYAGLVSYVSAALFIAALVAAAIHLVYGNIRFNG